LPARNSTRMFDYAAWLARCPPPHAFDPGMTKAEHDARPSLRYPGSFQANQGSDIRARRGHRYATNKRHPSRRKASRWLPKRSLASLIRFGGVGSRFPSPTRASWFSLSSIGSRGMLRWGIRHSTDNLVAAPRCFLGAVAVARLGLAHSWMLPCPLT
jgi:hypothetical protein